MLLKVAFCTAEVFPYSKTGGLGDVADSLTGALALDGVEVTVFSPRYRCARDALASRADSTRELALVPDAPSGVSAWRYQILEDGGRRFVFVVADELYDRDGLYQAADGSDFPDNAARFAHFCRAVLRFCAQPGEIPDVLHANDWQAALVPIYAKVLHRGADLGRVRSVLTIHNLAYQGAFAAEALATVGLGWELFTPEWLEFHGGLNLLKGGIAFADAITTVSPTYAREIQTAALGAGLDGVVRAHRGKLSGILNGIDEAQWNPARDPHLVAHYDATDLAGKAACKEALQREVGLVANAGTMLLGVVTRLDPQKGVHLIVESIERLRGLDVQLVVLGSGSPELCDRLRDLAAAAPGRVACRIGFDEGLAHRIEAGADAFLMPSAYEPCGLSQLYSHRYGTLPIVRATGGLADTVADATEARLAAGTASGFSFVDFTTEALAATMRRAADLYYGDPERWQRLAARVMTLDHSWATSAAAYAVLYRG